MATGSPSPVAVAWVIWWQLAQEMFLFPEMTLSKKRDRPRSTRAAESGGGGVIAVTPALARAVASAASVPVGGGVVEPLDVDPPPELPPREHPARRTRATARVRFISDRP
jgi:hypothetical protein